MVVDICMHSIDMRWSLPKIVIMIRVYLSIFPCSYKSPEQIIAMYNNNYTVSVVGAGFVEGGFYDDIEKNFRSHAHV